MSGALGLLDCDEMTDSGRNSTKQSQRSPCFSCFCPRDSLSSVPGEFQRTGTRASFLLGCPGVLQSFFMEQQSGCGWRQHRFLAERVYIGSLPESVQTLYVRRSPGVCFHSRGRGAWEVKVGGFGETLASVTRDQYWAVAPMGSRPPEQMPACNRAATQQKLTAM